MLVWDDQIRLARPHETFTVRSAASRVTSAVRSALRLVDAGLDATGIEDGPLFCSVTRHGKLGWHP
jgi:hypothetical protein